MTLLLASSAMAVGVQGAAAAGGPGSMSATPSTAGAGATGDDFALLYVAPSAAQSSGSVVVTVPAGWTKPQKKRRGSSALGRVSITAKTCRKAKIGAVTGAGPWTVPVKVSCRAGKTFTLQYGDVTVPTTAASDPFPATFTSGGDTTPLTSSSSITVEPGPLDHLVLQGSASTIAPQLESSTAYYSGTFSSTYTAEGFDQYDNPLGDVTAETAFSISPDGGCSAATCTVGAVGPHTVTGTDGSATGQEALSGDYSALQMICAGENYDVDGDVTDGCEQLQSDSSTTKSNAESFGAVSCEDGNGHTVHFAGSLLSDTRVHAEPAVSGFDPTVGSAPEWWSIDATGGELCSNDVVLTLTVTGSSHPSGCYQMTVTTDENTYSASTDSTGTAQISETGNQYTDNSTVYVEVAKTCSIAVTEAVGYTVDGHL